MHVRVAYGLSHHDNAAPRLRRHPTGCERGWAGRTSRLAVHVPTRLRATPHTRGSPPDHPRSTCSCMCEFPPSRTALCPTTHVHRCMSVTQGGRAAAGKIARLTAQAHQPRTNIRDVIRPTAVTKQSSRRPPCDQAAPRRPPRRREQCQRRGGNPRIVERKPGRLHDRPDLARVGDMRRPDRLCGLAPRAQAAAGTLVKEHQHAPEEEAEAE